MFLSKKDPYTTQFSPLQILLSIYRPHYMAQKTHNVASPSSEKTLGKQLKLLFCICSSAAVLSWFFFCSRSSALVLLRLFFHGCTFKLVLLWLFFFCCSSVVVLDYSVLPDLFLHSFRLHFNQTRCLRHFVFPKLSLVTIEPLRRSKQLQ